MPTRFLYKHKMLLRLSSFNILYTFLSDFRHHSICCFQLCFGLYIVFRVPSIFGFLYLSYKVSVDHYFKWLTLSSVNYVTLYIILEGWAQYITTETVRLPIPILFITKPDAIPKSPSNPPLGNIPTRDVMF